MGGVQGGGVGQDPAGDLAGGGRGGRPGRGGELELAEPGEDGGVAAPVALCGDLAEQRGDAGEAAVPAGAQVGLLRVQRGGAAGGQGGQQRVRGGRAPVPAGQLQAQAEGGGGLGLGAAGGAQLVHRAGAARG